ncbi:uncharacterized protein DUF4397 [Natranaerovirga pectinivora]|uniref:Uncharacterized protein DUF4397 n=1 Tax=Natranaerovirga pectinivora TaxID=682400 RepID=A0A4R3MEB0_9FIRM|nr:DUF4397 domain-containing protein [Natranaerovirga pectinivora]TCT12124.1 uncharacterized protein DUF4397 [Natranaerovirga pectinivora]
MFRDRDNYDSNYMQSTELVFPPGGRGFYPEPDISFVPLRPYESYIRFGHFSPDSPPVDVYLDDLIIGEGVNFTAVTEYFLVGTDAHTVQIYITGDKEYPIYEETFYLPAGSLVTLASINLFDNISFELINDTTRIEPEQMFVKFVNLSYGSPTLDLLINDEVYFSNIPYNETSYYFPIVNNKPYYNMTLLNSQTGELVLNFFNVPLEGNHAYTIYALGIYNGTPDTFLLITIDGSTYVLEEFPD